MIHDDDVWPLIKVTAFTTAVLMTLIYIAFTR
jgi:hypothetical protein